MKIKASRTITEEAELTTPCWFKKGSIYYFISEVVMIEIMDSMICRWENNGYSSVFQAKALEASTGKSITQEEFDLRFAEIMNSFDAIVHGEFETTVEKILTA